MHGQQGAAVRQALQIALCLGLLQNIEGSWPQSKRFVIRSYKLRQNKITHSGPASLLTQMPIFSKQIECFNLLLKNYHSCILFLLPYFPSNGPTTEPTRHLKPLFFPETQKNLLSEHLWQNNQTLSFVLSQSLIPAQRIICLSPHKTDSLKTNPAFCFWCSNQRPSAYAQQALHTCLIREGLIG